MTEIIVMPKVYTDYIVYSMCALGIGWATYKALSIQNMTMNPEMVKPLLLSAEDLEKHTKKNEAGDNVIDVPQTP